jgi:outer membrane protein
MTAPGSARRSRPVPSGRHKSGRGRHAHRLAPQLVLAGLLHVGSAIADPSSAFDPFDTSRGVAATPARDMFRSIAGPADCHLGMPVGVVDLLDAAEHALCSNPKTRGAWIDVKIKAAQLGSALGAYLPNLSATLRQSADHTATDVPSQPELSSRQTLAFRDYTLNMSWKLIDFGARDAEAEYAKQALSAAQAGQDDAIQGVFAVTVKDYYAAIATLSAQEAAAGTEDDARRSLQAAKARYLGGAAAIVDELQAQTQYAQAVFDRTKAAGDAKAAQGVLAVDMGLNPNVPLQLPAVGEDVAADLDVQGSIDQLIEEARRLHPRTQQARAMLRAAVAKVDSARAQWRPTLSINARANSNTQPVIPAVGIPAVLANAQERFIGLQLDIPIFDGFMRSYDVRAAQASVESQEENLRDIEQQVTLSVWSAYTTLQTDSENLRNTQVLLESARQSYVAAQQRYLKGIGSIIELLTAQTALGSARQRRVQSLADWRAARLELSASLGRLSLLSMK